MEPIGWIVGIVLFLSGYELFGEDEQQDESYVEVLVEPAYQRGKFFKTEEGYFISNLTPEPVMVDGCDVPILTADLSVPRSKQGDIYITEIVVECEGS